MKQSAKSLINDHPVAIRRLTVGRLDEFVVETLVWALLVIVSVELGKHAAQMALAEQDQLAQALPIYCLHPTLGKRIHVGCLNGGAHNLDPGAFEDAAELLREQAVVVEDQELLVAQEAVDVIGQVASNLRHELAAGVRSDASNLDHARGVMDHEEHVVGHKPALCPHVYGEEVGGSDDVRM